MSDTERIDELERLVCQIGCQLAVTTLIVQRTLGGDIHGEKYPMLELTRQQTLIHGDVDGLVARVRAHGWVGDETVDAVKVEIRKSIDSIFAKIAGHLTNIAATLPTVGRA